MRRANNYSTLIEGGEVPSTQEASGFTCGHCQHITHVKPFCDPADMGGLCKVCDSLICSPCYGARMKGGPCVPWEKAMERLESKDRFLRSAGIIE